MAPRYGRRTRSYRPKGRSYPKRKRFSKKRFTKYSTKGKTVVKSPVNARETFVKLPYMKTQNVSLGATSSTSIAYLGNSLIPTPASYASASPSAGDVWCSGVQEYANFYNQYRVLGCSLKIQLVSVVGTGNIFRCVLLPIALGGAETGSHTITGRIAELDALSYDNLCMQPYAQSKILGLSTGGNAACYFKMFRKSKSMLAIKDIRDDENTLVNLPDPDGSGGQMIINASDTWFYYLRIFNQHSSTQTIEVSAKLKYYTQLSGRTNWASLTVPA